MGKKCGCERRSNSIRPQIARVRGTCFGNVTATNSTRILAPGETIYLTCRFVGVIYHLRLGRGQFVDVSCAGSPNVVRVGCGSLRHQLPSIHLKTGDVLMISCS